MRILLTGAAGFLGRSIAATAAARGLDLTAAVRPCSDVSGLPGRAKVLHGDLRGTTAFLEAVEPFDVLVHAAAAKTGDLHTQLSSTVVATERLLASPALQAVRHVVLLSSFTVYACTSLPVGSTLDETTPVEREPLQRDAYTTTKLLQEQLVLEAAAERGFSVTIFRPGVVYGPENTWTARLGQRVGDSWVIVGGAARLPLTYVDNCADAVVDAVEHPGVGTRVLNVVDDHPPTQMEYVDAMARRLSTRPRIVRLPLPLARTAANVIEVTNRTMLAGRLLVPGVIRPATIEARHKPLMYANARLRSELGWAPGVSLDEALDISLSVTA